jgi:hypothetical protein
MRLAAQMKGGFYPAPKEAVSHAATLLRPPKDQPFSVLDPCAGEGNAIRQIGKLLGCPPGSTFAIELDDSRAEKLRATIPDANLLGPASFFGCRASLNSFSFIWLNPPFDHSYGGHRVEDRFLYTATDWLIPGGVVALVCPENVIGEYTDARKYFATHYENCQVVPFPDSCQKFDEVIVFGHKRLRRRGERRDDIEWEAVQAPPGFVYHIPPSPGLKFFRKVEPTETELQRMLAGSPLRSHLTTAPEAQIPSPPLALGIGHVALLLASGHLDGVVHPPGRSPHVVRGTSRKREFVSDVTEVENDDGSTTKKTTVSEKIELVVRTVDLTGMIQTFMDTDAQEPALAPAA